MMAKHYTRPQLTRMSHYFLLEEKKEPETNSKQNASSAKLSTPLGEESTRRGLFPISTKQRHHMH
jgi:hypothetical protein